MVGNRQVRADQVIRVTDECVLASLADRAKPDIGMLWELCVYLEWDRAKAVEGIVTWLGEPGHQRILDCACGSGFPAIDLTQIGYDVTCSDGSIAMIEHFQRNARLAGVSVEPIHARWEDLSGRFGDSAFDVVMCRGGGSLLYAGTWDDDLPPDRDAMADAVRQFAACLRPGGRLYVDITRAENLARLEPQRTSYPPLAIGDHLVELDEVVSTDPQRRVRFWRSRLRVDGIEFEFERRSHYLLHHELIFLLQQAGLRDAHEEHVLGETYTVFVGRRPGS